MDKLRIETLAAFAITVASVTLLTIFDRPIPVAIASILGALCTAILPALFRSTGGPQ